MADSAKPIEHVTRRPPILQASSILGIRDADVARAVGVRPITVSDWNTGKRPIPLVRHEALELFLIRHLGELNRAELTGKAAHRVKVAWKTALEWMRLAREEHRGQDLSHDVAMAAAALLNRAVPDLPPGALEQLDAAFRRGEIRDLNAVLEALLAEEREEVSARPAAR
jgi:DNA-binding transcriptional regulator YdaS (Cro superfamily)